MPARLHHSLSPDESDRTHALSAEPLTVLALAGSLRAGSYNRALVEACVGLTPEQLRVEPFEIHGIPLYNADLDTDEDRPEVVRHLKQAIARADGVLLASPEYNYGVPGVMKNVLDWASRPGFDSPFYHKPVAIMGAARGRSGTMRGQEQLKLHLLGMASLVFPHPGVAVQRAPSKFDDDLRLTDDATRDFVRAFLSDFAEWLARVR
jgi:chromate reductase